jgi:mannitol-1-phosphate 5-dehydrogenase
MTTRPQDGVVIFGAGSIGRGLLARLVRQAGMRPVLVEANRELLERLRTEGCYRVRLAGGPAGAGDETGQPQTGLGRPDRATIGGEPGVLEVRGFSALGPDEKELIASEVGGCAFAVTAVGGLQLGSVAAMLAPAIRDRTAPVNILVCENWPHADAVLAGELCSLGLSADAFSCARCSVEPMTIPVPRSLDLLQEAGQPVYVDAKAWRGTPPRVAGIVFTPNIDAYYARKLYTNNAGHAVLAYEGARLGCGLVYEALAVPMIEGDLRQFLEGAGAVMVRHFGLPAAEVRQHIDSLLRVRYANRELGDTIQRVGRDPLRKLGPDERLVGLLRLLQLHGLRTLPAARAIGAALHYHDPGDPQSLELARMIREGGAETVLQTVCGLRPDEACFGECLEQYREWGRVA